MDDAATLKAPLFFNRIRFGVPFSSIVLPLAKAYNFHPLLVWSLMRQESFFDRTIASSAGARGLMQIMPPTGEDLAIRLGWPDDYKVSDLDRPFVSIRFGLDYLDSSRLYLDGDLVAALAAYNGGPGNASIWKELAGDDPDLLIELIRFDEPRRYIKGIFEMYNIYSIIYGHVP
jgi:soluble lytic murein transglycosylase